MNDPQHTSSFWLGNALLGVSLLMLIFLGSLWESLGVWTMVLWMGLAGTGMYLVMKDKGPSSNMPD
ncbi:MAG: hypothetical protein Q8Q28_01670 [Pseudomonadota bacterium]|nr:hypothetical protein [Pseudomonadota bacterium]